MSGLCGGGSVDGGGVGDDAKDGMETKSTDEGTETHEPRPTSTPRAPRGYSVRRLLRVPPSVPTADKPVGDVKAN